MHIPNRTALAGVLLACVALAARLPSSNPAAQGNDNPMQLGAFSISLAVKDIAASRAFYEKLGFTQAGGVQEQNWLVLRNGATTIGLFQGMFEDNCLTFNPGWGPEAKPLESFEDVRDIQRRLLAAGLTLTTQADPESTGPAHIALLDPDGNPVLIDQHVPRPAQ